MALRGWFAGALGAALISLAANAGAQSGPDIRSQGGQTLEIAPNIASQNPQQSMPRPEDNVRIIPVIPPSQQVLTLPQASRDFIGKWGGHLKLDHHVGQGEPPEDTVVGLTFGDRGGSVVLATEVYGSRNTNILGSHAESDGPREVTFTVQGLDITSNPTLRHVEKVSLRLTAPDRVECDKLVDFYVVGFSEPIMEAKYTGTLKAMTRREERELAQEAIPNDAVPLWHVQTGNLPPQDQY